MVTNSSIQGREVRNTVKPLRPKPGVNQRPVSRSINTIKLAIKIAIKAARIEPTINKIVWITNFHFGRILTLPLSISVRTLRLSSVPPAESFMDVFGSKSVILG